MSKYIKREGLCCSDKNITDNYDIVSILVYNSKLTDNNSPWTFDIRYDVVSNGVLSENCTFESNIVSKADYIVI